MTPLEMLGSFQDMLNAPNNFWTDAQIWRRLQEGQDQAIRAIIEEEPSFFVDEESITTVADQTEYALPLNARSGTRFIFVGDTRGDEEVWTSPSFFRDYLDLKSPVITSLVQGTSFTLRNEKVSILPTPSTAVTDAYKVYFSPSFGNMIQGTLSGGAASTATLFTGAPNWTSNYGTPDVRDNYYRGMTILILTGSGAGEYRKISAYVGSTRVCTVDSAWTNTPTDASTFCIMCPVPEDHHETVVAFAAYRASVKAQRRFTMMRTLVYGSPGKQGMLQDLLSFIKARQDALMDTVDPVNYED